MLSTPHASPFVDLTPYAIAAGGDALARDEGGRIVFVAGALPGERVRARVLESKRDYAKAVTVDVLDPSPDRVTPPCPFLHAGCGGCGAQHVAVDAQRRLKRDIVVDALRRLGHLPDAVVDEAVALPAEGYRTTVRLAVADDGRPAYRRVRSHDRVPVDDCLVLHPLLADLVRTRRFDGADEVTLRCGARTGDVLVHPHPGEPDRPWYEEEAAGRRWRISAESFFQVRPDGADVLARLVADAAGSPTSAVDLYAGVGLFAGVLAAGGAKVVAVEGAAPAIEDAHRNLAGLHALVVDADVTRWTPPSDAVGVDVVVADPSRHGLGSRGVDVVAVCDPDVVVLVSCDAAALGRDARLLAERGWRLERSTPVDLFPHTWHVEVVSRFGRAAQPGQT